MATSSTASAMSFRRFARPRPVSSSGAGAPPLATGTMGTPTAVGAGNAAGGPSHAPPLSLDVPGWSSPTYARVRASPAPA